jgi:hypothetical protein
LFWIIFAFGILFFEAPPGPLIPFFWFKGSKLQLNPCNVSLHGFVLLGGLLIYEIINSVTIRSRLAIDVHLGSLGGRSCQEVLVDLLESEAAFLCEGGIGQTFPCLNKYGVGDAKHINNFVFVKLVSWWRVCLMSRDQGRGLSKIFNWCGGGNGSIPSCVVVGRT